MNILKSTGISESRGIELSFLQCLRSVSTASDTGADNPTRGSEVGSTNVPSILS